MQFLFPWFMAAAVALAVPIIIHLFHFRRFRKVRFTNVRFLREVKEETSNRARLRNLLVLAMRCLALLALVLGFAQPFIPGSNQTSVGQHALSIFVDNSFSMGALDADRALLEQARIRARQIIDAYDATDKFQILSNDFEGRHQRLVGKEDALAYLDQIRASPASRPLSQILARQSQLLRTSDAPHKEAYVISDFQSSMADISQVRDTSMKTWLVPLQAVEERNISIDSAWFSSPAQVLNQQSQLLFRVKNYGKQDADNLRLSIDADGQTKSVGTVSIKAGESRVDTLPMIPSRSGWHKASLVVSDYPIQFDDTLYMSYLVDNRIPVLLVADGAPNRYMDAALQSMSGFEVVRQTSKSLDYGLFSSYRLIILQDVTAIASGMAAELRKFAADGGSILLFPPSGADLNSYNGFLASIQGSNMGAFESMKREVSQINTDDYLFSDVYLNKRSNLRLPATTGNYSLRNSGSRGGEYLLTYRDGSPFLMKQAVENGSVYICASPIDVTYNSLVQNGEVFVPLLYKAALAGKKAWKIAYTIAQDDYFEANNRLRSGGNDLSYKMKGALGEFIPDQRPLGDKVGLTVNRQIEQAGHYDLYLQADSILATYGFNYNRNESNMSFLTAAELKSKQLGQIEVLEAAQTADLTGILGDRSRGIALWRWCLFLALFALLAESLILRFWKA